MKGFADVEKNLVGNNCVLSEPIAQHDVIYAEAGKTDVWEASQVYQLHHP